LAKRVKGKNVPAGLAKSRGCIEGSGDGYNGLKRHKM
jgi:hypothetical protein